MLRRRERSLCVIWNCSSADGCHYYFKQKPKAGKMLSLELFDKVVKKGHVSYDKASTRIQCQTSNHLTNPQKAKNKGKE